ncbi:MAG: cytochrome C, partial [Pirellulales bacterium]
GVGYEVGPNLLSITDPRPISLLTSMLDPSAAVDGKFVTYAVLTVDGRTFSGILASETGSSITLLGQDDKRQVILRNQVDELRGTGKSLMPDGLEKELSRQDLADLIDYLRSLRKRS